jgi:hypothetical protein
VTVIGLSQSIVVLPRNLKEIKAEAVAAFGIGAVMSAKKVTKMIGKRASARAINGISKKGMKMFLDRYKNSTLCTEPAIGAHVTVVKGRLKGLLAKVIRCVEKRMLYEVELLTSRAGLTKNSRSYKQGQTQIVEADQLEYTRLTDTNASMCQARDVILALTSEEQNTLVDKLVAEEAVGVGKPKVFVSYPEDLSIQKLMGVLENFAEINKMPADTLFWIDSFSASVHEPIIAEEMGRLARRMAHTVAVVSSKRNPLTEAELKAADDAKAELEREISQMTKQQLIDHEAKEKTVPVTATKHLHRFCHSPWLPLQLANAFRNKVSLVLLDGASAQFAGTRILRGESRARLKGLDLREEKGVYDDLMFGFRESGEWIDRLHGELLKLLGIQTQFRSDCSEDDGAGGMLSEDVTEAIKTSLRPAWAKEALAKLEVACIGWLLGIAEESMLDVETSILSSFSFGLDKRFEHLMMRRGQLHEAAGQTERAFKVFFDRLVWARSMAKRGIVPQSDRRYDSSVGDVNHCVKTYGFPMPKFVK